MNLPTIKIIHPKKMVEIPNRWELLSPDLYLYLCSLLTDYAVGKISYRQLHLMYVCRYLGLDPGKLQDETACENLYIISRQIDFIFKDPQNINSSFLAQLVPEISIKGRLFDKVYKAYTIHTGFDTLTCSLTAIQFIEAYELLGGSPDKLPLLAAILYYPKRYVSEEAHKFAGELKDLDPIQLQAVFLNFLSFTNYLFSCTGFSILRGKALEDNKTKITIGMSESLYNLSTDGLGDVQVIEQLPVIKYLSLLRKKLIESIKAMNDADIDLLEISNKTGLTIKQIKQII